MQTFSLQQHTTKTQLTQTMSAQRNNSTQGDGLIKSLACLNTQQFTDIFMEAFACATYAWCIKRHSTTA